MARAKVGVLLLAALAFWGTAQSAHARMMAPPPTAQRLAVADCVVVGSVVGIEDKDVEAAAAPGQPKVNYRIALVKVSEGLLGAKDLKTVRVGFVPPPPAGGVRPPGYPPIELTNGQQGLFLLTKHPEQSFYVTAGYFDFIAKEGGDFDKQVALVKRCVKLLEEPLTGLQAKSADDRFYTAALLLTRYRAPRLGVANPKTEAVDAKESKLILAALEEADWSKFNQELRLNPMTLFLQLGVTEKDGWKQPQNLQDLNTVAKTWLRDHGATYRIQRFVTPQAGKQK